MICISPHRNNCDTEVVEMKKENHDVIVFWEKFLQKKELLKSL